MSAETAEAGGEADAHDGDQCAREGCESPAETGVEWSPVGRVLTYCEPCASGACEAFPEIAEKVESPGATGS